MDDGQHELSEKLWDAIDDSPFMMLGLKASGHSRPMTAQVDDSKQIYFFASRTEELVKSLGQSSEAIATYASKGHDLFASIGGKLTTTTDREKVDELWNPMVATYYGDGGKDDPDLVLLRFDAAQADVWRAGGGSMLKAVWVKLTGGDPGEDLDNDENRAELTL